MIASLLLPSVIVIVMSMHPLPIGPPLLLPCIKHLNSGVNRHLLHNPMRTTDKKKSFGAGLTTFKKRTSKIKIS